MNTKQTGDETEAMVLAALIALGHSVAIPFGDNDKYDLLLDTGTRILRVQCKTGWIEGDVIRFKTASKTTVDGTDTVVDYDDTIDGFAVRCRETDELYWIPMEDAGKKSTYLRIAEPEIEHPSTKRESDYRLEKLL